MQESIQRSGRNCALDNCLVEDCDRVLLVDIDESANYPQADFLLKRVADRRERTVQRTKIRFPLCRFDDPDTFAAKIFDYIELLNEIVPEMKQDLLEIHNFREIGRASCRERV